MTTINDILGETCIFKAIKPYRDKCENCTGRKIYADVIDCHEYLSKKTHQEMSSYMAMKMMLQKIRDANDGGVVA